MARRLIAVPPAGTERRDEGSAGGDARMMGWGETRRGPPPFLLFRASSTLSEGK